VDKIETGLGIKVNNNFEILFISVVVFENMSVVVVAKKLLKPKLKKPVAVAVVPNPSFRLIDFHFQDVEKRGETSSSDEETSSLESGGGGKKGKVGRGRKPKEFIIQMFGVNEKKETCCLYVRHFHPFFYVQVGQDWTESVANQFLLFIKHKINPSMEQDVLSVALIERGPLYGFAAGKQAKFVEISFTNMAAFQAVKGLWYQKNRNGNRNRCPLVFQGIDGQGSRNVYYRICVRHIALLG
jgi:hypothetical protein